MQKLFDGLIKFKKEKFVKHKDLFNELKASQQPHTLFIGCSDSRVVPTLITRSLPGELFVIRNIANIVPPYRKTEEYVATTSAIEYAVKVLNVQNIVVCGHSNCGGCRSLYLPESILENTPHTKKWLQLAQKVKDAVLEKTETDPADNEDQVYLMTEQLNVIEQVKHLLSFPFIAEKHEQGKLNIYGWYYIIETGEVYAYNDKEKKFELIN